MQEHSTIFVGPDVSKDRRAVVVLVTVRPKYACRTCMDGVTQAPTPAVLIEGGLSTEGAIAHVLVSKYADHLPFYRQSQILDLAQPFLEDPAPCNQGADPVGAHVAASAARQSG